MFPFASATGSGSGTSTGSCHSTGPVLWWFQYEASNPTSCGLWWRPTSTLTDNVHHLSNGGYNIFSNFCRCSSEVGGRRLWTEFVWGSGWVLSIKSQRMRICASICAVAHYKWTKLVVGKKIKDQDYFNYRMFSSLRAMPKPPASNSTACHILRWVTCCSVSWLSCSGPCVHLSIYAKDAIPGDRQECLFFDLPSLWENQLWNYQWEKLFQSRQLVQIDM